jgi:uncharacterized glyoxalase superfamily protein PhnB
MNLTAVTPILNVSDVPASVAWFERMGWVRCFTYNEGGMIAGAADSNAHGPATFASVGSGEVEIFQCCNGQGGRDRAGEGALKDPVQEDAGSGVWMTWWVGPAAEVDAAYERAKRVGARVIQPPMDEPWGVRECRVVHPDGHVFRVSGR